jgi:hypothetical protein
VKAPFVAALAAALQAQAAAGLPLLSEVLYDAVGADDGAGFVELHGVAGSSLEGYTLEGVNGSDGSVTHTLELSGTIPADGIFVVADASDAGPTLVPGADLVLDFDFQNGPDSVVLRDALGAVVDALGYGPFTPAEVFAGEGSPAPDPAAGSSVARVYANVDTDDNAADFVALATPTPGEAPILPVPEPSAGLLLATGLSALALRGGLRPV